MKIVINACFGGFSVSTEAVYFMANSGCERAQKEIDSSPDGIWGYGYVDGMQGGYERNSKYLISAIETLGSESCSGSCAKLKIIEIPDGIEYEIQEYDGFESIAETHRTWQ